MRSFHFLTIALPSLLLLPACQGRRVQDLQAARHVRQHDLTNGVNAHGISFPITSSVGASDHRNRRRSTSTSAIGLGDYFDVYVSVIIPLLEEPTYVPSGCTTFY